MQEGFGNVPGNGWDNPPSSSIRSPNAFREDDGSMGKGMEQLELFAGIWERLEEAV